MGACGKVTVCWQSIGARTVSIHGVGFDAANFHETAFADHGVFRPASIAASVAKRQAEFLFGRVAARNALRAAGFRADQIGIGLLREPVFGAPVRGSITHTHNLAAAVVVPDAGCNGIGIDLEPMLQGPALESIEQMALNASERAILAKQTRLGYPEACTLVFSAKESFYKAVNGVVGYIFEFSALNLVAIDFAQRRARFLLTQDLSREWPAGAMCSIDFNVQPGGEMLTGFIW